MTRTAILHAGSPAGTEIELTAQESEILRGILEEYLGELRMEVAGTDSMDFREMLKEREVFVKKLLALL